MRRFPSYFLPALLLYFLFIFYTFPAVHPTGFSFYIFSSFLAIFIFLSSNNSNNKSVLTISNDGPTRPDRDNIRRLIPRKQSDLIMDSTLVRTEKSFRNLIYSNRNQIVFTIFRLIWKQMDVSLVSNQSENGKYNLI